MHLLLTGATGTLGLEVLRALKAAGTAGTVSCLVRAGQDASVEARWNAFLQRHGLDGDDGPLKLVVLPGDLGEDRCGLDHQTLAALANSVTNVLHSAAHLRFDATYPQAHATNVLGTERVIDLAKTFTRLELFAYVSTLFVAGKHTGWAPVGARPEEGFNNAYEQTKFEAEDLVRASSLPADIYRIALLLGRESDGYVHNYLESHILMEAISRGLCLELPGSADTSLDAMPSDTTAELIVELLFQPGAGQGRSYALAAGKAAPTMEQLHTFINTALVARGLPQQPKLTYFGAAKMAEILGSDDPTQFGVSYAMQVLFETVSPYVLQPKVFEASPIAIPPPATSEWIPRVLEYCIDDQWGRRRHQD